jgi:hypothetical protein
MVMVALAFAAAPAGGASSPACRTADLRVSHLFSSGAAGHQVHVFRLRNQGTATCHTFGYFGVQLLGRRGRALPTRARRTTHDYFGRQPKRRVTLRPGRVGSFRISTATGTGRRCVSAGRLGVIAPDDTEQAVVKLRKDGLRVFACQRGRVFVAPVQRGNGAR